MNQYGEYNYYVRVVSLNTLDEGYDLQHETGFDDREEAIKAYEAEETGAFTDKMLVDINANEVLMATAEELL